MDAVKYLKEVSRMCKLQSGYEHCRACPVWDCCSLPEIEAKGFEETVAIVEKWSATHPKNTNEKKFVEVFGFDPVTGRNWRKEVKEISESLTKAEWWDAPYKEPEEAET